MDAFLNDFDKHHYVIFPNENVQDFEAFTRIIHECAEEFTGKKIEDLTQLHRHVTAAQVNALRIKTFHALNNVPEWKQRYYKLAGSRLKALFGPDISIQIKLNLSIQLPEDAGSLLMLHSDTLSGQSPFECVLWTAITDAFDSNAMYIYDIADSQRLYDLMPSYQHKGMLQLFEDNRNTAKFLNVKTGTNIIFSSTLFHGNQTNKTDRTRISLNCRFKSLFSPEYATVPHERITGTFYEPLYFSPVTKIGLNYNDQITF